MAALVVGVVLAFSAGLAGSQAAFALPVPTVAEPTLPEPVATYISTGLLPRLADLYGPGKKAGSGIVFDTTAKVGDIHRLFAWTPAFLAGKKTDTPTQLTNNWVAPITVKGQVIGLATVWINPSSDQPELANFDLGPGLATALAAAPKGTVLIRDDTHSAWFASDGETITPLVSGTSGVATARTITAYGDSLPASTQSTPDAAGSSNGLAIAAIVLGVVVALLAIFVLLPLRRRRVVPAVVAVDEPAIVEPPDAKPPTPRKPATPKHPMPKPPTPRKPPSPKPKAD